MTRYVALLRGVNVGGRNKLPMPALRAIAEEVGFADVATYVQSGNLLLTTARPAPAVAAALREAVEAETGMDVPVVVRSHAELAAVVEANPLPVPGDPRFLHVAFFATAVGAVDVDPAAFGDETYAVRGREIYAAYPHGVNGSKLASALARKARDGTDRNWRTVLTLLDQTA